LGTPGLQHRPGAETGPALTAADSAETASGADSGIALAEAAGAAADSAGEGLETDSAVDLEDSEEAALVDSTAAVSTAADDSDYYRKPECSARNSDPMISKRLSRCGPLQESGDATDTK